MQRGAKPPLQVEPHAVSQRLTAVAWRVIDAHNLLSVLFAQITRALNRRIKSGATGFVGFPQTE